MVIQKEKKNSKPNAKMETSQFYSYVRFSVAHMGPQQKKKNYAPALILYI